VLTNDEGIAGRVNQLRSDSFKIECRDDLAGYNSLLGEMQAACLRAKLAVLDEWNERCREIATEDSTLLSGVDIDLPLILEYTESV
jgi:dTDP-4-amino-4,6-dideoxygalactose transaminase